MKYIVEQPRETAVTHTCDVLVAGGGIAGISAALAAARAGARVLLLEKQCLLGGLGTLGLITIYLPLCDGMGHQISFGISEELLRLSIKHGYEDKYPKAWLENGSLQERVKQRFEVRYNPHFFAVEAERLLRSAGATILYDTLICDAVVENSAVTHVIIENKSGRSAVGAKTVIDCTGDADVCKLSGAETVLFSQKNILANWYYYMHDGALELSMLGVADIPEAYKEQGKGPKPLADRRFTGVDGDEISEMLCMAHAAMLKHVLKKRAKHPTHTPVTMPTIPQLRMTRRIAGGYTLCDQEAHRHFKDSIGMISDWRKPGPVYEIPFSALYSRQVKNLITAGRCISVTDSMWDISRVIPACAVTGEAAGTAAAITTNFSALDVKKLQGILTKNGVILHETVRK